MKNLVLASIFMVLTGAAFANDDSGVYFGIKTGKLFVDIERSTNPSSEGALLGYRFDNGVAVEFEHTNSDTFVVDIDGTDADFDVDTNALYVVYRTQGQAFFKVKGGVLEEDVSADCRECDSIKESETGFSAGFGVGLNAGDYAQFELELTVLEEDVNFLSLGANLRF